MTVFDRKTLSILKSIKRSNDQGVSWELLQKIHGSNNANIFLLEALNKEHYIVTKNCEGEWIDFSHEQFSLNSKFISFSTPNANELIERRGYDFWKWITPTLISIVALIISIISIVAK